MKKISLFLLCLVLGGFFCPVEVKSQSDQVINSGGGKALDDGLKIKLKTTGGLCVYRQNKSQYYDSYVWPDDGGRNGVELVFRFDNGTTYHAEQRRFTACAVTPVHQEGNKFTTSISGYVTSPIQENGQNPVFYVTLDVTYTHPNLYFQVDYFVRAPNNLQAPQTVHLYLGHDAYILGHDGSRGHYLHTLTGDFVGNYRDSTDTNSCSGKKNNPVYPSTHGFKTSGTFRSYYASARGDELRINAADLKLLNTVSDACVDDAVGVEFTIGPIASGQTMAKSIMHCYGNKKGDFDSLPVVDPVVQTALSTPVTVDFVSATYEETRRATSHTLENVKIRVRDGVLHQPQIVNFTCSNGTATQKTDYSYVKGFIIPAGDYSTPQELSIDNVTIVSYATCQNNRTFNITIDPTSICNDLILRGTDIYATTVSIIEEKALVEVTNPLPDTVVYPGQRLEAITWTATEPSGVTYAWTNSNPSIGLAAKGTGDLPAFTATNATASPIKATITVTPTHTCQGVSKTYTITVDPFPTITYYYNGGIAPAVPNPVNYVVGPAFDISNEPTREGYTFAGWTCAEIGVTTPVKPLTIPAGTTADLNVYAHWGSVSYTITYELNGGEILPPDPNPIMYDVETEGFSLKNPVREGYTFLGWTGGQITTPQTTVTIPQGSTGDLTFTAHWEAISYAITYDLDGGTAGTPGNPSDYTIESAPITLSSPTRGGFVFSGWTGSNGVIAQTSVIIPTGSTGDRNYTATWTAVSYTINYEWHGGVPTPNPAEYNINTPDFTLINPDRAGYTFDGWSGTGLTGAGNLTVTIPRGSTGNRTYEAHWEAITYRIDYRDGANPISAPNAPAGYKDTDLPLLFSSTPVKAGYTFRGWLGIGASSNSASVTIPQGTLGDLEYHTLWNADTFMITFDANGGTNPAIPDEWSEYDPERLPIDNINLTPVRSGYTFDGWTGHGLTNQKAPFSITDATTGVPGNLTYTAQWILTAYRITYDLDGGTPGSPANPVLYDITSDTIKLSNPARPGYTFTGWTGSNGAFPDTLVTIPAGSTGDRNYTANWTADPYTITFDVNGGDVLSVPVDWDSYDMDHLPVNNISLTPTYPGYAFAGWTGHGQTNQMNPFGITSSTTGVPGNLTYTAQWILTAYRITYDLKGGTLGSLSNPDLYDVTTATFSLNNPTLLGNTFAGWTGTNGTTPQRVVEIPLGSTGDRTYVANWTTDTYIISYDYAGGVAPSNPNIASYNVDELPFDINQHPTRAGYEFDGWTSDNDTTPIKNITVPVGTIGDLSYTANWKIVDYSISYELNGGTEGVPNNPTRYNVEALPILLSNPTQTGYTFIGWTGANGTIPQTTVTIPVGATENRTYTANWSADEYQIEYHYAGGTPPGGQIRTSYYITDTPFDITHQPTRTGYEFAGWVGSNGHNPETQVSVAQGTLGDLTYTAQWTPVTYEITYQLNNGEAVNPGDYTIESAPFTLTNPTRSGYSFVGWSGTGLTGSANLSVTVPTGSSGNRNYIANWSARTYSILFDPDGGTFPSAIPEEWLKYDIEHLPTGIVIQPVRPGYEFVGWLGHGLYGDTINLVDTMPGIPGNLTFIAQWDIQMYVIDYDLDGGDILPGNPLTYTIRELPLQIAVQPSHLDPRRRFIGWSSPQLPDVSRQLVYSIPTGTFGNLTMVANWSQKLDDMNGGSCDTLFICQAPKALSGDSQAVSWTWILPDGSQRTTQQIQADQSGRYICRADYGSLVLPDTMHVYFVSDKYTEIEYLTTTGAKKDQPQQFRINAPLEVLLNATSVWTVDRGTIIDASTDALTVVWHTTGEKKISVQLDMNYGGVSCSQTLTTRVKITEHGLGFFVNQNVAGGRHDGSSWANAFPTLQEALSETMAGDRIWVAAGTYTPDALQGSFVLQRDSVEIYGGFEGTEDYLYERNPKLHPTILNGDGAHRVVFILNSIGARLDGLTIQQGRADIGAGVYFNPGATGTIANCIIRNNIATAQGGGIVTYAPWYSYDSQLLVNTEISANQAATGGGIFNENGSVRMLNVTVSGNKAEQAGGLYNRNGDPEIHNTILWDNVATQSGVLNKEIWNEEGNPSYAYSLIGGSKGSGESWLTELGIDGGHNKDANPGFQQRGVESDGVTLRDGDYHLSGSGAAVNAGHNTFVMYGVHTPWNILLKEPKLSFMEGVPMDLDYQARIAEDDVVDMGAREYDSGPMVYPEIKREVILPAVEGIRTDPAAGSHYVNSREDFVFTVYPSEAYANQRLVVTTSRTSIPDEEGVTVWKNADGSYQVTIHYIQDRVEVFIDFEMPDGMQTPEGNRIWSYRGQLHVKTTKALSVLRIYTLSGYLHAQYTLTSGETVIPLPGGVYVVTLDQSGMKQKIIVR
jgi:uncharacterized repeat protein (TIGR02543 family)